MTCYYKKKMDAIEVELINHGLSFLNLAGRVSLVKMSRDNCKHKDSDRSGWCQNNACFAGCDIWEVSE